MRQFDYYMKMTIRHRNWMLLHFLKREQAVWQIAFLRLCKKERLMPKGLRCEDKLAHTHPCVESKKLAAKHSLQYLSLTINRQYGILNRMKSTMVNGPLKLFEDKILKKARICLLKGKLKKLISLREEAGHGCQEIRNPTGFNNLSQKSFTQAELNILNKGPSFAPGSIRISNKERSVYQAQMENTLNKLHIPKNDHRIQEFCGTVKRILRNSGDQKDIHRMIRSLKEKDVVFAPSDKSRRLVALDRE